VTGETRRHAIIVRDSRRAYTRGRPAS